jgi:hypothetical protein
VSAHYCLSPFCLPHLYSIPQVHVNTYSILALLLVPGLHVILTRHTLLPPRYVFFLRIPRVRTCHCSCTNQSGRGVAAGLLVVTCVCPMGSTDAPGGSVVCSSSRKSWPSINGDSTKGQNMRWLESWVCLVSTQQLKHCVWSLRERERERERKRL